MNKYDLLIGCLDKKINEANSGMRVASPSITLSLNEAMNIKMALNDVKKLEDLIPELENESRFVRARNKRLEQENEKLEKALEFYVRKEQEGIA